MLVHPSDGSPPLFFDYREKAPLASTVDMFAEGGSRKNHRWVGVPGTVRGLSLAHETFGALPWADLVQPAVALAEDGFVVHESLARSLNRTLDRSNNDEFERVYGPPDGEEWVAGMRLRLPDLAATLARIRDHRNDGFYAGETARLIAAEMEQGGGTITEEDLALYRARVRVPIHFTYRGNDVYSAPPPSSGGITLAQMMQMLEPLELRTLGRWSVETNHLFIEAMRRAYAQRATHLGDPDFVDIDPVLWTKEYARALGASIDRERATPSRALGPEITLAPESPETTHFSVVDATGMAVSNTYTLEAGYGSGVVVRGAGFLLNNEMGDFNPNPGVTDTRGRIGTAPNLVVPQKRMLSSMTPTIVTRDGRVVLVTGSPGGRTIINTVLCVTMNVLEFGMDARAAVDAPRMDHEWFPERVRFMRADDEPYRATADALRAMGHDVRATTGQGDANTILIDPDGTMHGAADARFGAAAAPASVSSSSAGR
jgi:gamma-glutamyltranspeptidase/glutathione hydrolase